MKKLFFTDKQIVGLDINTTGIKAMAIDTDRWLVSGYGAIDIDPKKFTQSIEGDGAYLKESIQSLFKEKAMGVFSSNHVVIGLPTSRTYSRTFSMPLSVEKHLQEAVFIEVDQYVPAPAESLYIDYKIIERSKEELTVLMAAAPKQIIDKCVKAAEEAGLVVVSVEPRINAAARLLQVTEDGNLPTVIVDIGPISTDIAILDRDNIKVTGSIMVGGNTLTLDIAKKLSVTVENAYQLKVLNGLNAGPRQAKIQSAVEGSLQKILSEVRKVIRYYTERVETERKLEQLLVVGIGSNMPGIGEFFTNALFMPARVANPWQTLDFGKLPEPGKQFRARYTTVAGLASAKMEEIWQ